VNSNKKKDMNEIQFDDIVKILAQEDNEKVIRQFLEAILTPNEIETITSRWKLVCMLKSGMTQREIAKELGVSLCKITRGSRELKFGPKSFRTLVKKYMEETQKKG
jgi:TrpR family trp operon transcriptional repressor